MQTKSDFPQIMTRGRVLEGRTDLELEARGTIFQGRDEKAIMMKKKQDEQNAIKEALQKQIEEKNRRKEEEKQKERDLQAKEDARIRVEAPYEPTVFKKKLTMHNQNTVSIVGGSVPLNDTAPNVTSPLSPTMGTKPGQV